MAGFGEHKENTPNTRSRKKTGPKLLEEAVKLHKDGQLVEAERFYLQAIESGFHHEIAFSNLGVIYKNTNRLAKAKEIYKLAIFSNRRFADAHANLGNLLKEEGQLDQALASTLKSLELKPDNPTAHMNLGGIYKDLGQLDQALASTLKSLELKPDNPTAHINLGGIYKDLGQLDDALASTLKSLELKPDNPIALMNLGGIYRDLEQWDQSLVCLREAVKSGIIKEKASIELAFCLYGMGRYSEGIKVLSEIQTKTALNFLLSLYLCIDWKHDFVKCANDITQRGWLNPQGIAAIDHANILYSQTLDNGLDGTSLDSVIVQPINKQEFSDALIQEILIRLSSGSLQLRVQGHLANGSQTSGNILDLPEKPFQVLKDLLVQKIDNYNQICEINTDKNFRVNWEKNLYLLRGWAIMMDKGGNLKSHNHETGWLTGTFYLQMPEEGDNADEGAIEFSQQGPKYPAGTSTFERRVIRPNARDLNIFSSALFHRTLPFQSETQRICIAFDVTRNEKLWEAFY